MFIRDDAHVATFINCVYYNSIHFNTYPARNPIEIWGPTAGWFHALTATTLQRWGVGIGKPTEIRWGHSHSQCIEGDLLFFTLDQPITSWFCCLTPFQSCFVCLLQALAKDLEPQLTTMNRSARSMPSLVVWSSFPWAIHGLSWKVAWKKDVERLRDLWKLLFFFWLKTQKEPIHCFYFKALIAFTLKYCRFLDMFGLFWTFGPLVVTALFHVFGRPRQTLEFLPGLDPPLLGRTCGPGGPTGGGAVQGWELEKAVGVAIQFQANIFHPKSNRQKAGFMHLLPRVLFF